MNETSRIFTIGCLGLAAVLALTAVAIGQTKRAAFSIVERPAARSADARTSVASVREAEIAVDAAAFRGGNQNVLSIPLFDGKVFDARQIASEGSEIFAPDNFLWRGKLNAGKFTGDVVLTFNKGYISGLIYSPDAVFEIAPKGEKNILIELDQSLFPPCGGEIEGERTMANACLFRRGAAVIRATGSMSSYSIPPPFEHLPEATHRLRRSHNRRSPRRTPRTSTARFASA